MPVGFPDYYGGLTLPVTVPEGGTGFTAILAGALLYGDGSNPMKLTNAGTSGQVLLIDSVTGNPTFEDLTINVSAVTGILPVANGGTGTATPGLVAGAGIGITGSWPDQTITNSDDAYFSAAVLAIAHGGTGTATPALVAGAGIGITGSWPDQTIANSSAYATLADPLPVAHGGTGATSLAAAGIPQIVKSVDLTGQTAASSDVLGFTPSVAGMYRVSVSVFLTGTGTEPQGINVGVTWIQNGSATVVTLVQFLSGALGSYAFGASQAMYVDASQPIKVHEGDAMAAGNTYDLHVRLEAM